MHPGRPAARVFKQERAKKTHEALIRAGARVFAERGFEGAQTPDIAAAAGVSTGAFYRYFKDKRVLFIEVVARYLEDASAAIATRLHPELMAREDRRAAIDEVIDVLFEHTRRNAALARVYLAMSLTDPEVGELRARFEAQEQSTLAKLMEAILPREVVPDPSAAALVIQIAGVEVAAERMGLRPSRGQRTSERGVRAALREMFYRYLFPGEGLAGEGAGAVEPPGRRTKSKSAPRKAKALGDKAGALGDKVGAPRLRGKKKGARSAKKVKSSRLKGQAS